MPKQKRNTSNSTKKNQILLLYQITRTPFVYLVFFAFVFLIYGQTLQFYLGKLDEDFLILNHLTFLQDLSNVRIAFMRDVFLHDQGISFYRPLQTVSYMIDAQFFTFGEPVFYFTNMLLHAITCSVLFYLLTLLGGNRKTAFIFTLVYLASPLFAADIAWAPSRGDLLIGLSGILSLVFFIKMLDTVNYTFLVFCLISFFTAMFSKETAIFIPFLLALYYFLFEKKRKLPIAATISMFGGFLLIILLYFYLRSIVITGSTPPEQFGVIPFLHNLRTLPEYLAKFLAPVHLSPMPGFSIFNTILGLVLFACLAILSVRYSRKTFSRELFGFSWFLAFALPGIMYSHAYGSAAYDYLEHRSYLPMAGIILVLFFIYNRIPEGLLKNRIAGGTIIFAVVLGISSFVYSRNYKDPMVFFDKSVETNPASAVALNNRGNVKANLEDFQGAVADFEKALFLKHDYVQAYVNKGIALAALNDKAGAIIMYDSAIRYEPGHFQAHFNKAFALANLALYDDAVKEYTLTVQLNPAFVPTYTARGTAYFHLKNFTAAANDFSIAIKFDPKNEGAYLNRGKIRFLENNKKGACEDWLIAGNLGNSEALTLLSKYCH